ncbi:MAG: urate hydroxylase PuuD [Bacteroidota bacterium]|nr:urate hydroxylase PuuD [Bacteroidota bacterium]
MEVGDFFAVFFRWIHVVAGLLFVGLNWWFNLVLVPFSVSTDRETRKNSTLGLVPRALYWFRWSAIYTLVFGLILLIFVFYVGGQTIEGQEAWTAGSYIMVAVVFLLYRVYVLLANGPLGKNTLAFAAVGFAVIAALVYCMIKVGNFSYRGYVIHAGVFFGIVMIGNVFETIVPAQKKILEALKAGTAPDPQLIAKVSQRGLHNMYLSVPLLWTMIEAHTAVPAANSWIYLMAAILIGWLAVYFAIKKAQKVKGW